MIKLQAIGHLGKDCVLNNVNGRSVINFSLAHTEKFRDATGNQKDKTIWVECSYWTDKTGISPYLKRGTLIYVEGSPEVRSYTTNDGRTGATLSLRVVSIQLLGGQNSNSGQQQSHQTSYGQQNNYPDNPADLTDPIDGLPF